MPLFERVEDGAEGEPAPTELRRLAAMMKVRLHLCREAGTPSPTMFYYDWETGQGELFVNRLVPDHFKASLDLLAEYAERGAWSVPNIATPELWRPYLHRRTVQAYPAEYLAALLYEEN